VDARDKRGHDESRVLRIGISASLYNWVTVLYGAVMSGLEDAHDSCVKVGGA